MQALIQFAKLFETHGARLYLIGGTVRDKILGREVNKDIDLTSSLTLNELKKAMEGTPFSFGKVRDSLGYADIWCGDEQWDYAVFRKDTYKNDGSHFPKKVDFVKKIKYDARRRDFTVNSIYQDVLTGKTLFFFGAKRHLKKGILKSCQNDKKSFCEDALRILRLVRFAQKLNFRPAKSTLKAAQQCKHLLKNVSKNVIEHEMKKMPPNIKETKLWKTLDLSSLVQ